MVRYAGESCPLSRSYHEATKHRLNGYAPSPGFLDWDSQPNPFRSFEGAPTVSLPFIGKALQETFGDVLSANVPSKGWTLETIGAFFELSFALSAWKSLGPDRWALRMTPSSGNLHPTEYYLLNWTEIEGLACGVYHYRPLDHSLECRHVFSEEASEFFHSQFPGSFGALGMSNISWREEWKYGSRAYRYCQLDAGHAIAQSFYSAGLQGWQGCRLLDLSDAEIAMMLGLQREADFRDAETEEAECCLLLGACLNDTGSPRPIEASLLAGPWQGQANRLSEERVRWPEVVQAKAHCKKKTRQEAQPIAVPSRGAVECDKKLEGLIRQRRSAQRMLKEESVLDLEAFSNILAILHASVPLFEGLFSKQLLLMFYIHNVEGLSPGIYAFLPEGARLDDCKSVLKQGFEWREISGIPGLYALRTGQDIRKIASQYSCHQGIAGHGAFAVSFMADFQELDELGAWAYRWLHWRAGALGQALYLAAEAQGLNGTGIGCFFDDEINHLVSQDPDRLQVVYNFTIGKSREDTRLETTLAYS